MKNKVIRVVKIGISLSLIFILLRNIEYEEMKAAIKEIKISSIIVAIAIYQVSVIINAIKWRLLLPKSKLLFLIYLCFRAQFYSTVLPGQLFGEVSKLTVWKNQEEDTTRVATSVIYDRITGIIGQMVIAIMGLAFSRIGKNSTEKWWLLGTLIIILIFIYLSTEERISCLINSVLELVGKANKGLSKKLSDFYQAWSYFSKSKKILILSIMWGLVNQIVGNIMIFYLSKMLGLEVGFWDYCWIMPILSLISFIPISFAGIGIRDVSMTSALAIYHVPASRALVLSFSLLLAQITAAMIGGILILVSNIRKVK